MYSKKEKRHYSTTLIGRKKVMMSSHLGCPQNCRKDGCSQQLIYDLCLYDGLCYNRCLHLGEVLTHFLGCIPTRHITDPGILLQTQTHLSRLAGKTMLVR